MCTSVLYNTWPASQPVSQRAIICLRQTDGQSLFVRQAFILLYRGYVRSHGFWQSTVDKISTRNSQHSRRGIISRNALASYKSQEAAAVSAAAAATTTSNTQPLHYFPSWWIGPQTIHHHLVRKRLRIGRLCTRARASIVRPSSFTHPYTLILYYAILVPR